MSDSKKMSSPYVVLDNRPLDQWKVTELKEELKKRKLMTKGLKEDLVKRLDEAVRAEIDEAERIIENGLNSEAQPEVQSDDATAVPVVAEKTTHVMDHTNGKNEGLEKDNLIEELDNENNDNRDVQMGMDIVQADDVLQSVAGKMVAEGEGGIVSTCVESFQVVQEISVETIVLASEGMASKELGGQESQTVGNQIKDEVSNRQAVNGVSKAESESPEEEQAKLSSSDLSSGNRVVEVSQVQSDFISIDTISNTEKNELKDNVKLELDVKPEMVQPSFTNVVLDGSKSESVEVKEPGKDKASAEEKYVNNAESADVCKENNSVISDDVKLELDVKSEKVQPLFTNVVLDGGKSESVEVGELRKNKVTADSGDVGSSEKLNLDRSSGDDSMEEDALESKQIDSKFSSDEVGDRSVKIKVPPVKTDDSVDVMVEDATAHKNFATIKERTGPSLISTKRKSHDQETADNSEIVKRQRRWNSEGLEVPEQQITNHSSSTTPKDAFQTSAKRTFSRSESTVGQDLPKERVVPPSSKPPTTSLRIDHFVRPFTLKAVQELLSKTGTVVSFWMDHIKTHCYVTYSTVEEAIGTRNAVCNLQWPVNGGRLLMADFVDPQEVKNRVDAPPPSPATPVSTLPPATVQPSQPSPRLQVKRQQLPPPPSLPPPPPLSNPPPAMVRALPPPPLPKKVDPPIVTLDDLFRKTRATPRIYYLPLADKQVAAAQGKPAKQSAGVAFRKELFEQRWFRRSWFVDEHGFFQANANMDFELHMFEIFA